MLQLESCKLVRRRSSNLPEQGDNRPTTHTQCIDVSYKNECRARPLLYGGEVVIR